MSDLLIGFCGLWIINEDIFPNLKFFGSADEIDKNLLEFEQFLEIQNNFRSNKLEKSPFGKGEIIIILFCWACKLWA